MSYIPSTEADLKTFASNFASLIKAAPATYGLVANDATELENAAKAYASAYDLAFNPATRTAVAISEKNAARVTLTAILRGYAMQVKSNRAVSDGAKPAGAAGLQLFCHVGPAAAGAPADPLDSRFHSFFTKANLTMTFAPADAGKTAWYYARWQTATGRVGPWSIVTSMPVVG